MTQPVYRNGQFYQKNDLKALVMDADNQVLFNETQDQRLTYADAKALQVDPLMRKLCRKAARNQDLFTSITQLDTQTSGSDTSE